MKFRLIAALLLLSLLLAGCSGVSAPTDPAPADPGTNEDPTYALLFDPHNHISLNIRMGTGELAKMQADYDAYRARGSKSPIYRMADLDVTITTPDGTSTVYTLEQVGVRMKGNTSRISFYEEESGICNLIHLKLSFQETFDEASYYGADALQWSDDARKARKARTFAGLEKLDIKWNRCDDTTYLRETYAYEIFRSEGVPAPRTNLASVDWAGIHMGVYTIYEPVDKLFLQKRLPEEALGGDLYKCGWTSEGAAFTRPVSMGVEDEDAGEFYIYDLKTNKKTSDHAALRNLIATLNAGKVTREDFDRVVDRDNFLSFAAVSWFLGNPDDLRNNYNNCYVYFTPRGKAMFIPYDYDRCLGITKGWDPTGHGMTLDSPFSSTAEGNRSAQANPLFLLSVCQGGFYTEEYTRRLVRLTENPLLSDERFAERYALAAGLYGGETTPDKAFRNAVNYRFAFDPGSGENLSFSRYLDAKKATLSAAVAEPEPSAPADGEYWIRGDFTDWEIREEYAMTRREDTGDCLFSLSGTGEMRLKVYSGSTGKWYGGESLAPDSPVVCEADGHGNLCLSAGSYLIRFDPETQTIAIVRQS